MAKRKNISRWLLQSLAVLFFFSCDQGSGVQDEDEKHGSFIVDARTDKGTLFENKSSKQESILFTATGEWSFAPGGGPLGADGAGAIAPKEYLLPGARSFSLVVKRRDGAGEKVGAKSVLVLQPGEIVYFVMNELEGGFADNRGSLKVTWARQ